MSILRNDGKGVKMTTRICTKCKIEKDIEEFYSHSRGLKRTYCKKCEIEYGLQYQKDHPDQMRKKRSKYYKKNKEKLSAINKIWMKEHREERKLYNQEYNRINRERILKAKRNAAYKKLYGITLQQKEDMILNQDNKCLACGTDLRKLDSKSICVDHDHNSKKINIRGILCQHCNTALGYMQEDYEKILKLAEYVKKYCKK
jgi:hypothetical protein